jgi:DNA-binding GntR family transcriptional regulator
MDAQITIEPITSGSVVDLAYRRIRTLIESGELGPASRLRQGDLAVALGISRGSVREALHRLTAEELVDFKANRGFFVASVRLEAVLERLELRRILEPGIARLASERATSADVSDLEAIIGAQLEATLPQAAHDASRGFHIRLAQTTRNDQLVRVLESLWSPDIGRKLLAQRSVIPGWQEADAAEHREILEAVAAHDGERAAALMERHVAATLEHWSREAQAEREGSLIHKPAVPATAYGG